MRPVGFRARAIACILGFLALAAARPAAAETLQLLWDPSPSSNVAGYIVYVRVPGSQGNAYDVGNATSFNWAASDGQQYYFAVAAYAAGNVVGVPTAEIPRYSNLPPTLNNPGAQSTTSGTSATLNLTGSDPEGGGLIFNATNLPPGLSAGSNGAIRGTPTTPGAFVVTATVTDGQLSDAKTFTWTIAAAPQDVTAPAVVISVPNSGNVPTVVVQNPTPNAPANPGNAVANGPVQTAPAAPASPFNPFANAPVQTGPATAPAVVPPVLPPAAQPVAGPAAVPQAAPVAATNRFGRWRNAAITTPAPAPNTEKSVLARGPKAQAPAPAPDDTNAGTTLADRLRARVQAARNTAPVPVPTVHDAAVPVTVTATTEAARNTSWGRAKLATTTTATTVTDQPFITLAGSAADDRGIRSVEWLTDRGLNGTATGTDTWIAAVPLLPGLNRITVKVRDGSGNLSSNTVAVQYNERPPSLKK